MIAVRLFAPVFSPAATTLRIDLKEQISEFDQLACEFDDFNAHPILDAFDLEWFDSPARAFGSLCLNVEVRLRDRLEQGERWSAARTENLRHVLAWLYVGHHRQPGKPTKWAAANSAYGGNSAYRPDWSPKALRTLMAGLEASGLVTTRKGFRANQNHFGSLSLVWPTDELIELFDRYGLSRSDFRDCRPLVELRTRKDQHGRFQRVEPPVEGLPAHEEYTRTAAAVARVNDALAKSAIWLPADKRALKRKDFQTGNHEPWFDLADTRLRRIYSNVDPSSVRLDSGGRWYGAWWQRVLSDNRPFIVIDGEPVVELDYAGFHPRMIYHSQGLPFAGDPYSVPQLMQRPDVTSAERLRKAVKVLANVLLNESSEGMAQLRKRPSAALCKHWDIELPVGLTVGQVWEAFEQRHEPIRPHLGAGMGLKLQSMDSDLCESILLRCLDKGITALPVHDSYIVQASREADLHAIMTDEYQRRFGFSPEIKVGRKDPQAHSDLSTGGDPSANMEQQGPVRLTGQRNQQGYLVDEEAWSYEDDWSQSEIDSL